jgi:membrane associated rhomboid family serine protease
MFPLQDLNPTRRFPILTYVLIGLNVLVFIWEMTLSPDALQDVFMDLSVVPAYLTSAPFSLEALLDVVRSMFFHGGIAHIGGNMLYLYLFGDNLEDRLGRPLFLLLYFASGFAAALAQVMIDPTSTVPLVGASGAIAGVLGGYLLLFPTVRVRGIIPIGRISRLAEWPAWAVLALWFGLQLFNGVSTLGMDMSGGVAFFAHVGGFVMGMVFTGLFMWVIPQPPTGQRQDMLYRRASRYRY